MDSISCAQLRNMILKLTVGHQWLQLKLLAAMTVSVWDGKIFVMGGYDGSQFLSSVEISISVEMNGQTASHCYRVDRAMPLLDPFILVFCTQKQDNTELYSFREIFMSVHDSVLRQDVGS
ncbi:putative kelch-like ECH-associated protein 1-like [Homarus americanus]|uniref:Putative kelch-like ECH-associated protein 1-like n=1 Tax=Homarus americanus TaxID=6706 RepID=A0A8J5JMY1_HOMAM|nr:putative kelch-like ECH-associated protein 1-like [Homarus americanus]